AEDVRRVLRWVPRLKRWLGWLARAGYGIREGAAGRCRRRRPPRGLTVIASHPTSSTAASTPTAPQPGDRPVTHPVQYPAWSRFRAGAGGRPSGPKIQAGRTCDPGRAAPARAGARRSGDTSVQACTDLLPPRVLPP